MTQEDDTNALLKSLALNSQQVKVIEDGKVSDNPNIINSPMMQFIMQASMVSQLTKIRKYFDDRTSEGWVQHFDNIPVTDADPAQEFAPDSPGQSISITNYGPALIRVRFNGRLDTWRTLTPPPPLAPPGTAGETLNVNFETHELKAFYVQCLPMTGLVSVFRATVKG